MVMLVTVMTECTCRSVAMAQASVFSSDAGQLLLAHVTQCVMLSPDGFDRLQSMCANVDVL